MRCDALDSAAQVCCVDITGQCPPPCRQEPAKRSRQPCSGSVAASVDRGGDSSEAGRRWLKSESARLSSVVGALRSVPALAPLHSDIRCTSTTPQPGPQDHIASNQNTSRCCRAPRLESQPAQGSPGWAVPDDSGRQGGWPRRPRPLPYSMSILHRACGCGSCASADPDGARGWRPMA